MKNDNFDIEQELKKLSNKTVVEETLGNISDLFNLGIKVVTGSLILVTIYIAIKLLALGTEATFTHVNFDLERLWAELGNSNQTYLNDLVTRILEMVWISMLYMIVLMVLDNLVFAAISSKRNDSFGDKASEVISIVTRKIIPVTILVFVKTIIIGIGFLFFLLPGAYFWLIFILAEYVCIFENKGVLDSLKRSSELMVGCKGNFLTFVSIAVLLLMVVSVFKSFYNFNTLAYDLLSGLNIDKGSFLIAIVIEYIYQLMMGIYFASCCLLYFKRSKLIKEEPQNV